MHACIALDSIHSWWYIYVIKIKRKTKLYKKKKLTY